MRKVSCICAFGLSRLVILRNDIPEFFDLPSPREIRHIRKQPVYQTRRKEKLCKNVSLFHIYYMFIFRIAIHPSSQISEFYNVCIMHVSKSQTSTFNF